MLHDNETQALLVGLSDRALNLAKRIVDRRRQAEKNAQSK